MRVAWIAHRSSSYSGNVALLVHSRIWIHALLRSNVPELRIVRGRHQTIRSGRRSREIADQVQMLTLIGGNAERLLHQTIGLVAIPVWPAIGVVFRAHHAVAIGILVEARAATFAFHFAIGEKTSRHATRGPGLSVRPSSHASFTLVPYKDRAGLDRLPLLFGQTSLHTWEQSDATRLKQDDGVCWSSHMTMIGLHAVHGAVELTRPKMTIFDPCRTAVGSGREGSRVRRKVRRSDMHGMWYCSTRVGEKRLKRIGRAHV